MEEPEPWLSPERTAWAAMVVPWFIACERRICCAHPGGGPADADDEAGAALTPPTVPIDDVPPPAAKPARAPSVKLDLTDSLARAAARLRAAQWTTAQNI